MLYHSLMVFSCLSNMNFGIVLMMPEHFYFGIFTLQLAFLAGVFWHVISQHVEGHKRRIWGMRSIKMLNIILMGDRIRSQEVVGYHSKNSWSWNSIINIKQGATSIGIHKSTCRVKSRGSRTIITCYHFQTADMMPHINKTEEAESRVILVIIADEPVSHGFGTICGIPIGDWHYCLRHVRLAQMLQIETRYSLSNGTFQRWWGAWR